METIRITRDFYWRKCRGCKEVEQLPRAGKTYVGYSLEAEQQRDFERREYAKDLLQAWEPDGSVNELFEDAYGDPKKRGKASKGKKMEKERKQLEEQSKSEAQKEYEAWQRDEKEKRTKRQIRKAREKMKERAGKA